MRARLLYITNNYVPKIEIYSSLVGKVTGLSRLLRLGLPPCRGVPALLVSYNTLAGRTGAMAKAPQATPSLPLRICFRLKNLSTS